MTRVLKAPEVRKQEILDTAMRLFHDRGYDATSIGDIAKAMNVVPGLCYRYFANKQEIFDAAIRQYAEESCQPFLAVVHDQSKSFKERLDLFGRIMLRIEDNSRHRDFFHTAGNETFHLQLGIEMFKYISPHISRELALLTEKGEISVENPELMTEFLLYGQMPLWMPPLGSDQVESLEVRIRQVSGYVCRLVGIKE